MSTFEVNYVILFGSQNLLWQKQPESLIQRDSEILGGYRVSFQRRSRSYCSRVILAIFLLILFYIFGSFCCVLLCFGSLLGVLFLSLMKTFNVSLWDFPCFIIQRVWSHNKAPARLSPPHLRHNKLLYGHILITQWGSASPQESQGPNEE